MTTYDRAALLVGGLILAAVAGVQTVWQGARGLVGHR